jgi:hypothetical protein
VLLYPSFPFLPRLCLMGVFYSLATKAHKTQTRGKKGSFVFFHCSLQLIILVLFVVTSGEASDRQRGE